MELAIQTSLIAAVSGLAGAGLAYLASHRQSRTEQNRIWGDALVELVQAAHAVDRHFNAASPAKCDETTLRVRLSDAYDRVMMTCPLELTRPATQFVYYPFAKLKGIALSEDGLEAYDGEEQKLALVYRRVGGVNESLPRKHRGKAARADIAEQFR